MFKRQEIKVVFINLHNITRRLKIWVILLKLQYKVTEQISYFFRYFLTVSVYLPKQITVINNTFMYLFIKRFVLENIKS